MGVLKRERVGRVEKRRVEKRAGRVEERAGWAC